MRRSDDSVRAGVDRRPRAPQADRLETVRTVVEVIATSCGDWKEQARRAIELDPRHVDYYRQAAEVLGFLRVEGRVVAVTELGHRFLKTPRDSQQEATLTLHAISTSADLDPFAAFLAGEQDCDRNELTQRLRDVAGLSRSTASRRAQTLFCWRDRLRTLLAREPKRLSPSMPRQLGLFADEAGEPAEVVWPPHDRFPYNDPPHVLVGNRVREDLAEATEALIVTGYSSLAYLIDFLGGPGRRLDMVRLAFGVEPLPVGEGEIAFRTRPVDEEMRDYWLAQGMGVNQCPRLLSVVRMIDEGRLLARASTHWRRRLHAKIFVTPDVITLGSSNFSRNGMGSLFEANVRFRRRTDPARYREGETLAEAAWVSASEFTDGLRELLMALMQKVSWQEALARAAAELLEGDWAAALTTGFLDSLGELWPSQRQGIAQALWVLDNVGSVLVADATGSGKTRMASHLMRIIRDRMYSRGFTSTAGMRPVDPVVCVPPSVLSVWQDELVDCGLHIEPHSHGTLSSDAAMARGRLVKALQRAQVVAVDEAHNFLNPASRRTALLLGNMADHTVVFTATPINRGPHDLISIINLLGADNLDEAGLRIVRGRWKRRSRLDLADAEIAELRREVQRFTVRRTKRMLNRLVERAPSEYRNRLGEPCRYPEQLTNTYALNESEEDRRIATQIREAAGRLRGLVNLRTPIEMPKHLEGRWTEEEYVRARLRGAAGLARHHVMASLRSSRAALVEHLRGTKLASERFEIARQFKGLETGDVIGRVQAMTEPPAVSRLERWLPAFLRDRGAFRQAVEDELAAYTTIERLVGRLSDRRQRSRLNLLRRLCDEQGLVLAFDSRPISLAILADRLTTRAGKTFLATGWQNNERRQVNEAFALGTRTKRAIALCSDAMSEGLNLQACAVIVHLDMPSVIRVAEQRIGRIDRMDSSHPSIRIYWPADAEELALRSDERFVARHELVAGVLGANIELPPTLSDTPVDHERLMSEPDVEVPLEIEDAFAPVRRLVEGETALVPATTYETMRTSRVTVVSAISVVRAERPWAFFAIRATDTATPRWALIEAEDAAPLTGLDEIAAGLRERLGDEVEDLSFDVRAAEVLERFVAKLEEAERQLLPPKKRRALEEMERVLDGYLSSAHRERDHERVAILEQLLLLVRPTPESTYVDPRTVARCWLELIRPHWHQRLLDRRRRKPILLRDLRTTLRSRPLTDQQLLDAFAQLRPGRRVGERIAAAIVGVPNH